VIQIVTAGGVTVDLATREIGGIHYPLQAQYQWPDPVIVFASEARACQDATGNYTKIYSSTIELPTVPTKSVDFVAQVTDFSNPNAPEPDTESAFWTTVEFGSELSFDGTAWLRGMDSDITAGSGQNLNPLPMVEWINPDWARYMRFYYSALSFAPTWETDTITFSVSMTYH
jgi:hypothetical protein